MSHLDDAIEAANRWRDARANVADSRAELHAAIVQAARSGMTVAEIARMINVGAERATAGRTRGYSAERVRQIVAAATATR